MNRDGGDARTVRPGEPVTYHNAPERKPDVSKQKLSFKERGQAKLQQQSKPSSTTGPKQPPVVMQLPGGVIIKGFAFRITRLDTQGRAIEFELATGNEDSDCVLWATPKFLAEPLPADLKKRVLTRIEESIEGPAYETKERTYVKGRSHGISEVKPQDEIVAGCAGCGGVLSESFAANGGTLCVLCVAKELRT